MILQYILNDAGEPEACDDMEVWGLFMSTPGARQVADDTFGDVRVSTIFLGIDHAFGGGSPVLWETMIFGGNEEYQERYTSRIAALQGHAKAVAIVARGER